LEGKPEPIRHKVLLVTPLPPEILGGIEEYAYRTAESLSSLGYSVDISTTRLLTLGGLTSRESAYPAPPRVERLASIVFLKRPVLLDLLGAVRLARMVRECDLVHVMTPYPLVESIAAFFARVFRRPLVITYVCDGVVEGRSGRPWFASLAETMYDHLSVIPAVRSADVICSSSLEYVSKSRVLPQFSDRTVVVHQGIDASGLTKFTEGDVRRMRTELLGNRFDKIVTYVGRLVPYKGVGYLLRAFDLLRKEGPGRPLLVIGGAGQEMKSLKSEAARLGVDDAATFLGYVPEKDLPVLFSASDVFVAPSISASESTPITLLQALSLGVPVVGTTVGGTGESIPNDGVRGLIVRERDARSLKDAIQKMLTSVGRGGERPAIRSWADVAADYAHIYARLLGAKNAEGVVSPAPNRMGTPHA
jgi:glycosyltransferase involved in cell wall biosynthesis